MTPTVADHLEETLNHIYINPLEKCNLKCKICYTRKTDPILSADAITDFISRYQAVHPLQSVKFCGGEVMALAYFPKLVNQITDQGMFVQIITNGTLDRLGEFTNPNAINLIVSLDGLPDYHDANRGEGNFAKSLAFCQHALGLAFHLDIFSIVTRQNLPDMDKFEAYLKDKLGQLPNITYHPRKPAAYLESHPVSNIVGETSGFDFLTPAEMLEVMKTRNVFPPKQLGCYEISVASDGKVYGCCEGTHPLGQMTDPVESLIASMKQRLEAWDSTNKWGKCLGCSQPGFMCGIKQYLQELYL